LRICGIASPPVRSQEVLKGGRGANFTVRVLVLSMGRKYRRHQPSLVHIYKIFVFMSCPCPAVAIHRWFNVLGGEISIPRLAPEFEIDFGHVVNPWCDISKSTETITVG
jgi:hypothetical protein